MVRRVQLGGLVVVVDRALDVELHLLVALLRQEDRLRRLRAERSSEEVHRRLDRLRSAAGGTENLMPHIYEAVKAYATLGEICDELRTVFGAYEEVAIT